MREAVDKFTKQKVSPVCLSRHSFTLNGIPDVKEVIGDVISMSINDDGRFIVDAHPVNPILKDLVDAGIPIKLTIFGVGEYDSTNTITEFHLQGLFLDPDMT
jgi:hypothetical protein